MGSSKASNRPGSQDTDDGARTPGGARTVRPAGPRRPGRILPAVTVVAVVVAVLATGWCLRLLRQQAADRPVLVAPATSQPAAVVEVGSASARPDRIVLTWTGDPRTELTVTWRTSMPVSGAHAEIAVAQAGPAFRNTARRVEAGSTPFTSDRGDYLIHTATFTDLQPGTQYLYRVGHDEDASEWFACRTAPAEPEPFCFLYLGDVQNDIREMWPRVLRRAFAFAPHAAFQLYAGDLVNHAQSDEEWGEWFDAGIGLHACVPVIATPGNHEHFSEKTDDGKSIKRLGPHWRAHFAFPRNGPPGLEETVYRLDYQNLRIVSLNTNERQAEQAAWLETALSGERPTWTVATFHHPVFAMARDRDSGALRELLQPVLESHGVDLVLTGHDHVYGRTGLQMPAAGVSGAGVSPGTVYVVSVCGPKMYALAEEHHPLMRRQAEQTQLFQVISIDGPVLRYEARTALGDLYDAFTLTRLPDGRKELTDQIPDTPERRRSRPATAAGEEAKSKTDE